MIVEQRIYDIVPGKIPEYLELYRTLGVEVQTHHLGCLLGYYHTEIGDLNQIIHLWQYADLDDRRTRRGKLFADPRWLEFFNSVLPMLLKQRSILLNPAPFVASQPALVAASI
tara:strand:+ start:3939 stop:4277 length:339 start_codon:yes stop_codon:yes gene_type:complete